MHKILPKRIGKPREGTFVLPNVGVCRLPQGTDSPGWNIGRMTFSQAYDPSGEGMQAMFVTGGEGRLCLGFVRGKARK